MKEKFKKKISEMEGHSEESVESEGEIVCAIYMEWLLDSAIEREIGLAERPDEVVAFGKLGLCCRRFRLLTKHSRVINMFDYLLEYMCMD